HRAHRMLAASRADEDGLVLIALAANAKRVVELATEDRDEEVPVAIEARRSPGLLLGVLGCVESSRIVRISTGHVLRFLRPLAPRGIAPAFLRSIRRLSHGLLERRELPFERDTHVSLPVREIMAARNFAILVVDAPPRELAHERAVRLEEEIARAAVDVEMRSLLRCELLEDGERIVRRARLAPRRPEDPLEPLADLAAEAAGRNVQSAAV